MERFEAILQAIMQSWQQLRPELLREILAPDIVYYEDPHEPPLTSIDAVIDRWEKDLKTHSGLQLDYKIVDIEGDNCIAQWSAQWNDSERGPRMSRGVYYLHLDQDEKLHEFRQWWM